MLLSSRRSHVALALCLIVASVGCGTQSQPKPQTQSAPVATAATLALPGTSWGVENIEGTPVVDSSQAMLKFAADSTVTGTTGCNHFTGAAKIAGDQLTFTPLATTRKMCMGPLMNQEHSFLKAIEGVRRYSVDANGALLLVGADAQPLMRLVRATP